MVTYAYLRVSTNQQDVDNQRHSILEYVNQKSLGHLEFISDSVSGQKKWRERKLGELLTSTAVGVTVHIPQSKMSASEENSVFWKHGSIR